MRYRSIIRRSHVRRRPGKLLYSFENYTLDTDRRELRRGSDLIGVEPQVFDLLEYLIRNGDAGLVDSTIKARITDAGASVLAGSAAEFGGLIAAETEKWAKVIKFANIKAE